MANEKKSEEKKSGATPTPKNIIKAPVPFFRWEEPTITGTLQAAIAEDTDPTYGKRTLVQLDTAQVNVPMKYAKPWSVVPVGSKVTITKVGQGRDTSYELGWDPA